MRYEKNLGTLTAVEQELLSGRRICVVGCGALGGYCLEQLARLGVGNLTAIDGDTFEPTNLNRQLLALEKNIGQSKAEAAAERLQKVNSQIKVNTISAWLTADNAAELLRGHDIIIDASGDISTRRVMISACADLGIPLVIGTISGWNAQVMMLEPGSRAYDSICPPDTEPPEPNGNPVFTAAICASIQVAEAVKILCGRGDVLKNCVLCADFLWHEYQVIRL